MRAKEGKKALGLTASTMTADSAVQTAQRTTALTPSSATAAPAPKRRYKARARKCKCCKKPFTPKRNSDAKFCSATCRNKDWRRRHPKAPSPAEPVLAAIICEHCGSGALVPAGKGRKYCSATCRTLAWKARRASAAVALSQALGMSLEKARDVVDAAGMKELQRILTGLGLVYNTASRRWVVLVDQDVFVRQESI